MKKIKVKFPKGIVTVHIPFAPYVNAFEQHYKEIARIDYPKSAKSIEAVLKVRIDLADGKTSYQMGEVSVHKDF